LDDPDDLSYEESDADAAAPSARAKGKGKERVRDVSAVVKEEDARSASGIDEYRSTSDEEVNGDYRQERPNKFHGSSSTWGKWTRRERQEWQGIEKLRARDLSAHLFNAFALKKSTGKRALHTTSRDKGRATPAPASLEDDRSNSADPSFAPNKPWTAWPMPPHLVPRPDENRFRDEVDMWTMRMEPDMRPSAELEECLIAEALKTAKVRFNERNWEPRPASRSRHNSVVPMSRISDGEHSRGVSGKEDSVFEEQQFPTPVLKPVVLADDDKARTLLRSSVRHILTKFDELLMALHRAKGASVAMSRAAEAADDEARAQDGNRDPMRKKRRISPPTEADSGDEAGYESEASEPEPPPKQVTSSAPAKGRNKRRNKSRARSRSRSQMALSERDYFGPRDWGDVLGVASMIGWAQPVVMRASRRCAELFDEDMLFRTMDEGRLHLEQTDDQMPFWKYTDDEEETTRPSTARSRGSVPDYVGKLKEYARYCPVQGCPRQKKGFSRTWNLNQHLKVMHPELTAAGTTETTEPIEATDTEMKPDPESVG
jgi:hypothetical protein